MLVRLGQYDQRSGVNGQKRTRTLTMKMAAKKLYVYQSRSISTPQMGTMKKEVSTTRNKDHCQFRVSLPLLTDLTAPHLHHTDVPALL
jgi:hypothetical protein